MSIAIAWGSNAREAADDPGQHATRQRIGAGVVDGFVVDGGDDHARRSGLRAAGRIAPVESEIFETVEDRADARDLAVSEESTPQKPARRRSGR